VLKDIVEVRYLGGHRLRLRFEDGLTGDVDVAKMIDFKGVFAPLRDETEFARARVDPESGTVVWPNGADLDPDVLYAAISGKPIVDASAAKDGS
jgi:hypothetical protein